MVHGLQWIGLLGEELFEQAVDVLADVLNGRHCQLALTAGEVMVKAALGRAGNFQQFIQANTVQAFTLQGVGHGVDQFVAGRGLFHGLNM